MLKLGSFFVIIPNSVAPQVFTQREAVTSLSDSARDISTALANRACDYDSVLSVSGPNPIVGCLITGQP